MSEATSSSEQNNDDIENKPTCIIVLGMAGSGKTTFVSKLVSKLYEDGKPYVINIDPACREVPYPSNIGILKKKISFIKQYFLFFIISYQNLFKFFINRY